MSLKTWKAEFYPVTAKRCSKKNALEQALLVFIGFRPTNLARHSLVWDNDVDVIADFNGHHAKVPTFDICGSVALCEWYIRCNNCPLENCFADFAVLMDERSPEPMIKLLRKCIRKEKAKK